MKAIIIQVAAAEAKALVGSSVKMCKPWLHSGVGLLELANT